MVEYVSTTQQLLLSAQQRPHVPLESCFLKFERVLRSLASPGGQVLLLLLMIVLVGYTGAALGVPGTEQAGASALITLLLVLARRENSPGLVAGFVSFLKNGTSDRKNGLR
jgi:hypothetical protein